MPIEKASSGFYEWDAPLNPVPALGIDSNRIQEVIAHYHEASFRGLFGHQSFGFDQRDLNCLTQMANATYLWLWDVALEDIEGVYALSDLTHAGINPKRPGIDFSKFRSLRTVVNHWIKKDTGIAASTIEEYFLWHFKPRSKSFEGIEFPANVEKLELNWANPISLDGFPRLENLRSLRMYYCRNLCDLSALPEIAPRLEYFTADKSKRVESLDGVTNHPTLQSAYINGVVVEPGT